MIDKLHEICADIDKLGKKSHGKEYAQAAEHIRKGISVLIAVDDHKKKYENAGDAKKPGQK